MRNRSLLLALCLVFSSQLFAADLPNHRVTPGKVDERVTQENLNQTICSFTKPSWSKSNRPPSNYTSNLKRIQIAQYGYSETSPSYYEEDHLIPISIGGAPHSPENLWPQPRNTITEWSAEKKDALEFALFKAVCKGDVKLVDAQQDIAFNWIKAYQKYEFLIIRYHNPYKYSD